MRRVQCGSTTYVFQEYRPDFEVDFPIFPAGDRELDESAGFPESANPDGATPDISPCICQAPSLCWSNTNRY